MSPSRNVAKKVSRKLWSRLFLIVALVLLSACARHKAKPAAAPVADAPKQLSQEEIQKAIAQAATPGEKHKALESMQGKWVAESKFWMDPSKDPETAKADVDINWILGKRFLEQRYRNQSKKLPFEGIGTLGYDNATSEYVSTWIDTMSTGVHIARGPAGPDPKVIETLGAMACPVSGASMQVRNKTTIVDKNKFTFEMFSQMPDKPETRALEIVYTRKGTNAKAAAKKKS